MSYFTYNHPRVEHEMIQHLFISLEEYLHDAAKSRVGVRRLIPALVLNLESNLFARHEAKAEKVVAPSLVEAGLDPDDRRLKRIGMLHRRTAGLFSLVRAAAMRAPEWTAGQEQEFVDACGAWIAVAAEQMRFEEQSIFPLIPALLHEELDARTVARCINVDRGYDVVHGARLINDSVMDFLDEYPPVRRGRVNRKSRQAISTGRCSLLPASGRA